MKPKRSIKWAALAACVIPALVAGCNGGTTGGNPFGNPVPNGTFTGSATTAGANRAAIFTLNSFSNNTINGNITVTATAPLVANAKVGKAAAGKATAGNTTAGKATAGKATAGKATAGNTTNSLVVLPVGVYGFVGTRNGINFSGSGTFPGPPSINYTVSGTLSTTTNGGSWVLTGTVNGEPFTMSGGINALSGGGGGGGAIGSFTFSSNASNVNTSTFIPDTAVGNFIRDGEERSLASFFTVGTGANIRVINVAMIKNGPLAVNDTFLAAPPDPDSPSVGGVYSEGSPVTKLWGPTSGSVRITAINGNKVTVQLTNLGYEPAPLPGLNNQATGTFAISGSGTVTLGSPLS
jgi:hypothetical protein